MTLGQIKSGCGDYDTEQCGRVFKDHGLCRNQKDVSLKPGVCKNAIPAAGTPDWWCQQSSGALRPSCPKSRSSAPLPASELQLPRWQRAHRVLPASTKSLGCEMDSSAWI